MNCTRSLLMILSISLLLSGYRSTAQAAYKKVIQEFADQEVVVTEARIRLSRIMVNIIEKENIYVTETEL